MDTKKEIYNRESSDNELKENNDLINSILTGIENQYMKYQYLIPDLTKLILTTISKDRKFEKTLENPIENIPEYSSDYKKEKLGINKTVNVDLTDNIVINAYPVYGKYQDKIPECVVGSNSNYSSDIFNKQYTGLCISVGGIRGLLQAGAIHEFYIRKQLDNVNFYAGSSVGSMICTLLAIGYTPLDILTTFCSPDISTQFSGMNIMNLPTLSGFYPNTILREKIQELIMLKIGYIPTFKDMLTNYNKYLIIPVYCLSENTINKRKIYCSPENTPDMKVLDAVILSCSIPIVFQKAKYNEKVYLDGAYTDMFPIKYLCRLMSKDSNILGITLEQPVDNNLNSLMGYLIAIHMIPLYDQEINKDDIPENAEVIELCNSTKVQSFKFNLSVKEKMDMFSRGSKQIKNLIKKIYKNDDQNIDNNDNIVINNDVDKSIKEKKD